jgi:hypothetical protein
MLVSVTHFDTSLGMNAVAIAMISSSEQVHAPNSCAASARIIHGTGCSKLYLLASSLPRPILLLLLSIVNRHLCNTVQISHARLRDASTALAIALLSLFDLFEDS